MNTRSKKLTVFVGSASEAANIDRQVRSILDKLEVSVLSWRELCGPGDVLIDRLLSVCGRVDAAIFIASPDDLTEYRGGKSRAPRDNILLEIGMCLSRLGRKRVLIVHYPDPHGNFPRLPSDLDGLITLKLNGYKINAIEEGLHRWLASVKELGEFSLGLDLDRFRENLNKISSENRQYAQKYITKKFNELIDALSRKEFILTQTEYYSEILKEIDAAGPGTEIIAIALMSSQMLMGDKKQGLYNEKNIEAANRGAKIRRLFIYSGRNWKTILPWAYEQVSSGIEVRRAPTSICRDIPSLKDIVIFSNSKSKIKRGYEAEQDRSNKNRIRHGKLILDVPKTTIECFEHAWDLAEPISREKVKKTRASIPERNAPGHRMRQRPLPRDVVTCEEAASAKHIPLANELKTLLLRTSNGLMALHLRGDRRASLRAVKAVLPVKQAYLAEDSDLAELGLAPGTVCAVLDPIWKLPHLISRSVLDLKWVSTNSGTQNSFFRFSPRILLKAKPIVGDFDSVHNSWQEFGRTSFQN